MANFEAAALLVLVFILMIGTIPALLFLAHKNQQHVAIKQSNDIKPCVLCHTRRAGLKLSQTTLTGAVIFSNYRSFSDYVCPQHAQSIHSQFQRHTLLWGWWSLHGFVRAPIVLSENRAYFSQYSKALSMATSK